MICVFAYKAKDHRYEIITYNRKMSKICANFMAKCVNDGGENQAIVFRCPT